MPEYQKVKKIQKLSNLIGCMKRFEAKKIELLLLVVHFIIIILCIMNILIIPWKILNKSIFALRIVDLSFLLISLICLVYNQISRKLRKLSYGYYYCVGFFGSLFSILLIILNFLFILISCCVIVVKVRNYKEKRYDSNSILIIDVCSLVALIPMFFLWYSEFLRVYAKTDGSLKDYIDAKIRFHQSQNQKVVNVDLSNSKDSYKKSKIINNDINFNRIDEKNKENNISSKNKMEINNEKPINNRKNSKDDDISSVETK